LLERWRRRRAETAGQEPASRSGRATAAETPSESLSLIERWRRRRAERSELAEAERVLTQTTPIPAPPPAEIEEPDAQRRATGTTSRPMTAEELHGARPVIGGRLQWSDETEVGERPAGTSSETVVQEHEPEPAAWRPVPMPTPVAAEPAARPEVVRFVFHLAIGFLAGAVLLVIATGLTSIITDGSVALLELRGLPIFVGGATSIVVFALLRTSGRTSEFGMRRSTSIGSVVAGLLVLVALAALLYRPAAAERLQPMIERALNVFTPADEAAANGFKQDIDLWNDESSRYRSALESSVSSGISFDQFRTRAGETEVELGDLVAQMRTHAKDAQHPGLRDALDDLASIYDEELGGLRLVNRGLLIDGIDLIKAGDKRFKDADARARTFFRDRLKRLLERAGIDSAEFGKAIAGSSLG
jgi:hypothetical protein